MTKKKTSVAKNTIGQLFKIENSYSKCIEFKNSILVFTSYCLNIHDHFVKVKKNT